MPAPEFLVELRRHVGHDKLWLPGVVAIVVRDVPADAPAWQTPEVLLVKNADSGAWTPVTGIVEPDEQPHDAAEREVKEETTVEARAVALLGVGASGTVTYPNGDVASFVESAYRLEVVGNDEPAAGDDEILNRGWFQVAQLPAMDPRFRLLCADAVAQLRRPDTFRPRMGWAKRRR